MPHFVTRPLSDFSDHEVDLNDVAHDNGQLFVRDGVGFAGCGTSVQVPLRDLAAWFESSSVDDTVDAPGSTGMAFGAHPFLGRDGVAYIPQISVGKDSAQQPWVTVLCDTEPGSTNHLNEVVAKALVRTHPESATPASFTVRPGVAVAHYLRAVETARDAVRRGHITKAVIARDIIVESSEPIAVHALLKRLKASFGSSYRYSINGFVGASPELLVSRHGEFVASHPLAGTTPRTGDPSTDARLANELRASSKNQIEHRVVIDMVHDTLLPWCSYLDWQPEPDVVAVANVQHLGTRIEGKLSLPYPHVVELVNALSPTPALGGAPREAALRLIAAHEGVERGLYGGAVGWCDRHGNGTWAVAIRCAALSSDRRTARLFAGGGIVADSEPLAELAETQAKFQAMLAAIVRP